MVDSGEASNLLGLTFKREETGSTERSQEMCATEDFGVVWDEIINADLNSRRNRPN